MSINATVDGTTYYGITQITVGGKTVALVESSSGGDDIPSYVTTEAQSVASRVRSKLQNDSIVFMVGSDSHQDATTNVINGNLHGGMAMKILKSALSLDFAAYLGDYTTGSSTTTLADGRSHFASINADIADAFSGLPQFRTVGNHDPLGYSYSQNGEVLSQAELYTLIGKYNADSGATMGSTTVGYCYRDFTAKNVRVICLNTSDVASPTGGAENVSDTQKQWFADTLLSTPSGYGIIILSHHPLDWGNIMSVSHILRAYVEEQSSINIGGTTYSFTNTNKSAWVLQFHGHVHCYKVDNLHWNDGGVGEPYDVMRIAVPNMCFGRNNEYGSNSTYEYYNLEFGENITYNKTANSGNDTAFCVMVVNPTEQKVHAICYGAGYDREVFFGGEAVAVTGVTLNAASGTLAPGATTTLTATVAPANATNKTVLWSTSNSSVATVSNGTVTAVAEGTATITATTQDGNFTATYTLTVEEIKRGNLRDYFGYTDGYRVKTSTGEYSAVSGGTVVEYIDLAEFATNKSSGSAMNTIVIRTRGVSFEQLNSPYNDNAYVFYTSAKAYYLGAYLSAGENTHGSTTVTKAFSGTEMTLTINIPWSAIKDTEASSLRYLRICGLGSGANLDIRVNENFD